MTQDQFLALVRQVIPFLAGMATGYGWLSPAEAASLSTLALSIAGPAFLIGSGIWSFIANSKKSILLSAGQMPEVQKVVMNDAVLAASVPSTKVDTNQGADKLQ